MVVTATTTVEKVREKFADALLETSDFRNELTLVLKPESLVEVCTYLKNSLGYTFLETITAVDWLEREPRFDVIYQLLSMENVSYIRLKVRVGQRREKNPAVPSVTGVWAGANWYEREIWDLFGITFNGHPNLQRILMPMDWTTHPLRKDYPLTGIDLPEPYWGGQVPYDVDPGVDSYYQQTLRSPAGRPLNESRSKVNPGQEPGTTKK